MTIVLNKKRVSLLQDILQSIKNYLKATDKLFISFLLVLSSMSLVLLYSMFYNGFIVSIDKIIVQLIATLIGIVLMIIISLIDYKVLAKLYKIHVPITLLLVLLTFTPLGIQVEGTDDKAWLNIFNVVQLQPSELLKISFILTLAMHLSFLGEKINKLKNILLVLLHGAVPITLIILQGDYGSAIVFCFIFAAMVYVSPISWKIVLSSVLFVPSAVAAAWFFLLKDFHKQRFLVAFNPELDPLNVGFQQMQGKIALGSGKIFGRGLFNKDLMDVPEMRNDFIFSYIGQTTGLIGCIVVLALLFFVCIKILYTAKISSDKLGKYIAIGIFSIVAFQTFINVGMVLNFIPVIGITLPFLSSGGTSVITMYMATGVALSVYMKNNQYIFKN